MSNDRVTVALHELVFAMDGYADRVLTRQFGIDHNRFVFLTPLLSGPLDGTRLARRLNLTKAAVSKRVPLLVGEGWLTASPAPEGGRRVVLSLTPAARDLLAEAGRALNARFVELLAQAEVDAQALSAQLQALIAAVHAIDPEEDLA